jgi:hypothetical protein
VSSPIEPPVELPITRSKEFWALIGDAVTLGVFGGFAGLLLGFIHHGEKWNVDSNSHWVVGAVGRSSSIPRALLLPARPWPMPRRWARTSSV